METWLILLLVYLVSAAIALKGAIVNRHGNPYITDYDRQTDLILILVPILNTAVAFYVVVAFVFSGVKIK